MSDIKLVKLQVMSSKKKLIIPEINADILTINDRIIANPNCSTIQLIMALYPLDNIFKIRRVVVSTYQSVTGTGASALQQLEDEGLLPGFNLLAAISALGIIGMLRRRTH